MVQILAAGLDEDLVSDLKENLPGVSVETCRHTSDLADRLSKGGYALVVLEGDLTRAGREKALEQVNLDQLPLIC
jgi:superfamily II DNA/RNA helicase